jgi:hypothetical protein
VAEFAADQCRVTLSPGLFGPAQSLCATGGGDAPLAAALASLAAVPDVKLPRRARLTVPDERVYYALLPATVPWAQRHAFAARHFAETLGRQSLVVRIGLIDGGRSWLAAAMEEADLAEWTKTFAEAGFVLASVRPALLRDLDRIADRVPDDAVVAIVRNEGAVLARIATGEVVDIRWERGVAGDIEQRIVAFARAIAEAGPMPPVIVFAGDERVRDPVSRMAAGHGWRSVRTTEANVPQDDVEEAAA